MPQDPLHQHVASRMPLLTGPWVARNSSYDDDLAEVMAMTSQRARYWDASWDTQLLEFKKGRSIWLDLVRYSEIKLGLTEESRRSTRTLFFVPDSARSRIDRVLCVETSKLVDFLGLTELEAAALVELRDRVPRSLNAQASLTLRDIASIATFAVG